MGKIDLSKCDNRCTECVKHYIKKHSLIAGESFDIPCSGIPKQYIEESLLSHYDDPSGAIAIYDPVIWAEKYLDWYCIDPEGEVWKRKTEDGSLPSQFPRYSLRKGMEGRSPFNRDYQSRMLRCSSKRKIFRLGRQTGKSESLCIAIAHAIFTNQNFKVVIVTPYQSQIDLIFNRLIELVSSSDDLFNSVAKNRRAPSYYIELYNGSYVRGFTAGTKSKSEAGSVRGQPANMLVLDEADMLSKQDIDAVVAVITNFPNATVWMSSTPTGKREKFFENCKSKQYREFHYPASSNPLWSEELEAYFRSEYTELGYIHEAEAEFGEQEEGVYQNRYVDIAKSRYEYSDMKVESNWIYAFGVDWNDTRIGTQIIITGYNPGNGVFSVVDKQVISRDGWTQTAALNKIMELNRLWRPQMIYVDQGYGHAQIEFLRGFGYKAKGKDYPNAPIDAKLAHIVKGYNFGGNVEIHDIFTKQPVKKPAKAFLVESAVRRFETGTIKYPRSDEKMTASLLGYIIKSVRENGTPVYEASNEVVGDHLVDALNLSLIGFVLEKTELGKPKYSTSVTFTGQFGETPRETRDRRSEMSRESVDGSGGRTDYVGKGPSVFRIPAVRTRFNTETQSQRIWSWPGFFRDEPPPKSKRRSDRRFNRPRRSNI
jgi:replicative DNA helicase